MADLHMVNPTVTTLLNLCLTETRPPSEKDGRLPRFMIFQLSENSLICAYTTQSCLRVIILPGESGAIAREGSHSSLYCTPGEFHCS